MEKSVIEFVEHSIVKRFPDSFHPPPASSYKGKTEVLLKISATWHLTSPPQTDTMDSELELRESSRWRSNPTCTIKSVLLGTVA